jgi:hypothetical protein
MTVGHARRFIRYWQTESVIVNEDELKKAIKAEQPFQPVRIHLSNGATFSVEHPDAILIGPRTTAILFEGAIHLVANVHVNHVEPLIAA